MYAQRNFSFFQEGTRGISQIQLNSLIKNVEFYKLQHGEYPDSLQQLLSEDKLAPITDVIQINQGRQNTKYYYKKCGNRYILLSSGKDGKPNTKDDLYPQIMIADSTKIGLINN